MYVCLVIPRLYRQTVAWIQFIAWTAKMSTDFISVVKEGPVKIKGKHLGVTILMSVTLAIDSLAYCRNYYCKYVSCKYCGYYAEQKNAES